MESFTNQEFEELKKSIRDNVVDNFKEDFKTLNKELKEDFKKEMKGAVVNKKSDFRYRMNLLKNRCRI